MPIRLFIKRDTKHKKRTKLSFQLIQSSLISIQSFILAKRNNKIGRGNRTESANFLDKIKSRKPQYPLLPHSQI